MLINPNEIIETIKMIKMENFDIRTVTMGINLRDCADKDINKLNQNIYNKITTYAKDLVGTVEKMEVKYGVPIVNKRISVTPISIVAAACEEKDYSSIAKTMDKAAKEVGVDFIGGFSGLVHKGYTKGEQNLIKSIPKALSQTDRVCSSINVATTNAGINMDAVLEMGEVIKETAELTKDNDAIGCAKLVVFANVPEDNPFMAGAFHGVGEPEAVINVGVSGPGVVKNAVDVIPDVNFDKLATTIKQTAFKITRMGELIGNKVSEALDIPFGIVDLSLAPTPAIGDSIANILESMGLERCGTHGTTAALALLNDAVKKGGAMASSHVGGLSGAFIPVSEDQGMIEAAEVGALSLSKLEAMTSVCSVGLDMIAVPGSTTKETLAAIIADEMAIGMINKKTTAVRIIPVPGKDVGDDVEFGGLLGRAPIMDVNQFSSNKFVQRGGRIPAPIQALNN
ncbi:PFL family protein [Selenihalanaerobacter shriftii]|uniref:UPF0210 protein SAMN02745118_00458 n=1 Tax=Selenihalanaerobacter shriftii TaxID=142842 RepID=A0A1T4JVX0_9FIRM|nr:PFL family protein [Selenihalanaerobacter shriftii]SJZ34269.1 hypothetical protein SAMN02745118_00458 [Selenihalanaerobacter shriftii]